ncbi:hypothetical protein DPMN_157935 [Dreissena polymorpha]|uniref:Uncharacterized protein n=1 Tax=Dreissena polymorpha TaxID=45954 RepID=A0A9D4IMQ8_DREPO|nr:hypothetical protein DPMN_157935 [Dreissena polymorpha]
MKISLELIYMCEKCVRKRALDAQLCNCELTGSELHIVKTIIWKEKAVNQSYLNSQTVNIQTIVRKKNLKAA